MFIRSSAEEETDNTASVPLVHPPENPPEVGFNPYTESAGDAAPKTQDTDFESMHSSFTYHGPNNGAIGGPPSPTWGRRHIFSLKLILPMLVVVIGTAGMATALLTYLLVNMSQSSISEVWNDGGFSVIGDPYGGSFALTINGDTNEVIQVTEGQLSALPIASAASKVANFTAPLLIGLYAFYTAGRWIHQGDGTEVKEDLPTPLQYGLLLYLLTDSGLGSLLQTGRYVTATGRAKPSYLLIHAFLVTLVIYISTHAIGAVDLWLIATSSIDTVNKVEQVDNTWPIGVGPDACLTRQEGSESCSQTSELDDVSNIPLVYDHWTNVTTQLITVGNLSRTLVILMAPLDTPGVFDGFTASGTTIGLNVSCQSINHLCQQTVNTTLTNCTDAPQNFPRYHNLTSAGFLDRAEVKRSDLSITTIETDNVASADPSNPHPFHSWMQFEWFIPANQRFSSRNPALTSYIDYATMLNKCTMNFYNVTVQVTFGEVYEAREITPVDIDLSRHLVKPFSFASYSLLIANVEPNVFTSSDPDGVIKTVEQALARFVLESASMLLNARTDLVAQSRESTRSLARYPIWPVAILLTLLYAHAVLALVIFILAASAKYSETLHVGDKKPVSTLELAQQRLRSPLALVADVFPPDRSDVDPHELSVRTDELDLFGEHADDERVRIGLHASENNGVPVFGIWRRRGGGDKDDKGSEKFEFEEDP